MSGWVAFVAVAGGAALLVAYVANRWIAPSHLAIDAAGLDLPPGLTVFTSTDCSDCSELMSMLRGRSVSVREVTYELEPQLFERAGVGGVPVTVAIAADGDVRGQIAGLPRPRALDRLIRSLS